MPRLSKIQQQEAETLLTRFNPEFYAKTKHLDAAGFHALLKMRLLLFAWHGIKASPPKKETAKINRLIEKIFQDPFLGKSVDTLNRSKITDGPHLLKPAAQVVAPGQLQAILKRLAEVDPTAAKEAQSYANAHGGSYELRGNTFAANPVRLKLAEPLSVKAAEMIIGDHSILAVDLSRANEEIISDLIAILNAERERRKTVKSQKTSGATLSEWQRNRILAFVDLELISARLGIPYVSERAVKHFHPHTSTPQKKSRQLLPEVRRIVTSFAMSPAALEIRLAAYPQPKK